MQSVRVCAREIDSGNPGERRKRVSRAVRRGGRLICAAALALLSAGGARAQSMLTLSGTVVDGKAGAVVAAASVILQSRGPSLPDVGPRRVTTGADGAYRFDGLTRGRYTLSVERFGYRTVTLEVLLDRDQPLSVSILIEPVPFPLDTMSPGHGPPFGPSLVVPRAVRTRFEAGNRAAEERVRQQRFLSHDVRQLGHADLRESNTLAEDDVLRAFQRLPGVGVLDDYSADLWTRGAPAGQTAIFFDGIPLIGGMHALGVFTGVNSDMLSTATFQPGVASAALGGAGAGVIELQSRSGSTGAWAGSASLSPVSARLGADGPVAERMRFSAGARRSYVDAFAFLPDDVIAVSGGLPYVFADVTARMDLSLSAATRMEASAFWQDDRVFGDVEDHAYGNAGAWGARILRGSYIVTAGEIVFRQTIGLSGFDASVKARASGPGEHAPLHPATENRYRALVWETRVDAASESADSWSVGLRATQETREYNGPGIDLARLLSPDEFLRRGIADLTPIIRGIERAHLDETQSMIRLALWAERRARLADRLDVEGGLRIETGDRVLASAVRLAPRVRVRYTPPGSPLSLSAAYGRAWQYMQSIGRTDVLRSGLRASEIRVLADGRTPALRSDVVTLGAEYWRGTTWLFGSTAWLRVSSGALVPEPTPGVIDAPRPVVPATGRAHGVELSARRLDGRTRGFLNYTLAWSRMHAAGHAYDVSEDRRHVANIGMTTDLTAAWLAGATVRVQSGSPYTRITLIDTECATEPGCTSHPPVLYGAPGGQRGPAWASLDLLTEWTHTFADWSFSVYGQLRNVLGSRNATTYHSSCVCVAGETARRANLQDRYDRGLPRLPVIGLRARFRG